MKSLKSIYNFLAWYYRKLESIFIDNYLGVKTSGIISTIVPGYPDVYYCETLYYWHLRKIFDQVTIHKSDVFYDLGSGYGRVLFYAAEIGFSKIEGFELRPDAYALAIKNIAGYRNNKSCDITIKCMDVADVDVSKADVIYMYNPFGLATLKKVIEKNAVLPKGIQIIYFFNENIECVNYMNSLKWAKVEKVRKLPCNIYTT